MSVMSINKTEAHIVLRADLVLTGGNVLTMNPSQPSAEAIAVKGDRIVKVGANDDVTSLVRKKTIVIDLQGKTVVPGFIDTHIHVVDFGKVLTWVDLTGIKSIQDVKNAVKQRIRESCPDGKWIIGRGWDEDCFIEKRLPTRADLDPISMGNPVLLYRRREQICVVNSRALELAGVTEDTGSPQSGALDKNGRGELTGILRGDATDLVWKIVPEPDEEELVHGFYLACEAILQAGVTGVHWIVTSPSEIPIVRRLRKVKLPIRIHVIVPANFLDDVLDFGFHKKSGENALRVNGVLIFADGFLAARTAALREPYSDTLGVRGKLLCTPLDMRKLARRIQRANLDLTIHAMGDLAAETALDVIEAVSASGPNNRFCRLEQAALLDEQLVQRIRRQDVIVSMQPRVAESEFFVWSAIKRLGNDRAKWLYPIKTLFAEGVRVIGGSDCPMESLSPLLGIQAAVAREYFPEQRITVDEALRIYTINAAYASFEENTKGSIETGKLADFTILSHDPHEVSPKKIGQIKVEMTIVGGRVVNP